MKNEIRKKYKKISYIGKGAYGEVSLLLHKENNKNYVCKKIYIGKMSNKEKLHTKQEINILKLLKHKNIVSYKESFLKDDFIYIIMEYC